MADRVGWFFGGIIAVVALFFIAGFSGAFDNRDPYRLLAPYSGHRRGLFGADGKRAVVYEYDEAEWEPVAKHGDHLVLRRKVSK